MAHIELAGSVRTPPAGTKPAGPADPGERCEVTLVIRRQNNDQHAQLVSRLQRGDRSLKPLTRHAFGRRFGAHEDDQKAIRKFAAQYGLKVTLAHSARRTMKLSGTVAQLNAAFSVDLQDFYHAGGRFRAHPGPVQLPEELHGIVVGVLGLDNRIHARPHFRINAQPAQAQSFDPIQMASLYNFPAGSGQGQCIALIELGGGFQTSDLQTYFAGLDLPVPQVTAVAVDGGSNQPTGDPNGADGEVMLDIEIAGAIAPNANLAVYFAPNTDAGFLDAITSAIHDTTRKPSVISISWGGAESSWSAQSMTAFDQAFQDAASMGITICVASGDSGSSDGVADGADHVDFPSSSSFVLACGGTRVDASGSAIASETVWNDGSSGGAGGGGVSTVFALPSWQQGLHTTMTDGSSSALAHRGVPDVAADADPRTGYNVLIDGSMMVVGGTSAVAPLWAALIARINANLQHPLGYLNPLLYGAASSLNDITQGDNGDFAASTGWDACTGLGSPDGARLATALESATTD